MKKVVICSTKRQQFTKKVKIKEIPLEGRKSKKKRSRKGRIFVVHDHKAKRAGHHHDLRLEYRGTLKSWAIPKRIDPNSKKYRLAIQVENHPLSYANFEGKIPEGEYGAGTVKIFDKGTYETISRDKDNWVFELKGKKLKGIWKLSRTEGNKWILKKVK